MAKPSVLYYMAFMAVMAFSAPALSLQEVQVAPESLEFTTTAGADCETQIVVRNYGDRVLNLLGVSIQGDIQKEFTIPAHVEVVYPNQYIYITIRFSPASVGIRSFTLLIQCDHTETPEFRIPITATVGGMHGQCPGNILYILDKSQAQLHAECGSGYQVMSSSYFIGLQVETEGLLTLHTADHSPGHADFSLFDSECLPVSEQSVDIPQLSHAVSPGIFQIKINQTSTRQENDFCAIVKIDFSADNDIPNYPAAVLSDDFEKLHVPMIQFQNCLYWLEMERVSDWTFSIKEYGTFD